MASNYTAKRCRERCMNREGLETRLRLRLASTGVGRINKVSAQFIIFAIAFCCTNVAPQTLPPPVAVGLPVETMCIRLSALQFDLTRAEAAWWGRARGCGRGRDVAATELRLSCVCVSATTQWVVLAFVNAT